MNFGKYAKSRDIFHARESLANHLLESDVDLDSFNSGLELLEEWGFNPLKSFAKGAGAAGGAMLGAVGGIPGMVAGGYAGSKAADGLSNMAGKAMSGSRVEPIVPVYQQAISAVDKLSKMLGGSDMPQQAQGLSQQVQGMQKNLQGMSSPLTWIDQNRNQALDAKLSAGGGIGNTLRSVQGNNGLASGMRNLGDKIKNIPVLNKDQGLRRAMSKGMDAVQDWASKNPRLSSLLNVGAGAAGALAGAGAVNSFGGGPQFGNNQGANQNQGNVNNQGNISGMDKTIQNQSVTSPDAGEFVRGNGITDPDPANSGFNKDGAMKVWNDKLNHDWGHPGFSKDATTGQWRNNDPTFVHRASSGQWEAPNIPPQVQTPGMSQDVSGQWHNNMNGRNFKPLPNFKANPNGL